MGTCASIVGAVAEWPAKFPPHAQTVPSYLSARLVVDAGGDLGHVGETLHRHRRRAHGRRAVAELTVGVAAPAHDGAVGEQREAVLVAARDRARRRDARHRDRDVHWFVVVPFPSWPPWL